MNTYRRPLSQRLTETLAGVFFATLEHQINAVTCALGLTIVGVCIVCTLIVIGNLP